MNDSSQYVAERRRVAGEASNPDQSVISAAAGRRQSIDLFGGWGQADKSKVNRRISVGRSGPTVSASFGQVGPQRRRQSACEPRTSRSRAPRDAQRQSITNWRRSRAGRPVDFPAGQTAPASIQWRTWATSSADSGGASFGISGFSPRSSPKASSHPAYRALWLARSRPPPRTCWASTRLSPPLAFSPLWQWRQCRSRIGATPRRKRSSASAPAAIRPVATRVKAPRLAAMRKTRVKRCDSMLGGALAAGADGSLGPARRPTAAAPSIALTGAQRQQTDDHSAAQKNRTTRACQAMEVRVGGEKINTSPAAGACGQPRLFAFQQAAGLDDGRRRRRGRQAGSVQIGKRVAGARRVGVAATQSDQIGGLGGGGAGDREIASPGTEDDAQLVERGVGDADVVGRAETGEDVGVSGMTSSSAIVSV